MYTNNKSSKLASLSVQNQSNSKQIKIGNYFLGTTIGKGNSAVVKIATHTIIKHKTAIKIFDKSGLDNEKQLRLRREIDSMKRLKHQNIIRLYEIMETGKLICLVTEYASNGELYDFIMHKKRLSEREARHIFKQIVTAVHYCHVNHIVHRDIKVENILLDSNWRVKLADFGFSSTYKQGELLDIWCGSPQYCAPELYKAQLYDGPKVDIWSLGVVLYVLVCGYLPFEAQQFTKLRSQVIAGSYKIPFFLSEDCKSLINGMLTLDPNKRFSITDIINHKWFQFESDSVSINSLSGTGLTNNNSDYFIYQEFRNLIDKIEQISIKEFKPDENILLEISKYGINVEEVIKSVRNNEFDSNAGIYYLVEAKFNSNDTTGCNLKYHGSCHRVNLNQSDFVSYNNNQIAFEIQNNSNVEEKTSLNNNNINKVKNSNNFYGSNQNLNQLENCFINGFVTSNGVQDPSITITNTMRPLNKFTKAKFDINSEYDCFDYEKKSIVEFANSLEDVTKINQEINIKNDLNEEKDHENSYDEDDEMPIEELGRDYLFRYNAIRRHTIGTNFDNNQSNYIVKSTECLPMLQVNDNLPKSSRKSNVNTNSNENLPNDLIRYSNNSDLFNNSFYSKINAKNPFSIQYFDLNKNSNQNSNEHSHMYMPENVHNSFNSISLLHNQQEKNRLQETNSFDCKYLHPFSSKEENKCKNLKQQNELGGSKKFIHQHRQYHSNFKYQRSKNNRLVNGPEQQQNMQQESGLNRRASDGGSNISLFNQFYSLRNVYLKNSKNENDIQNQDNLNLNGSNIYQSRGSITSGIPIFSASTLINPNESRPESPTNQIVNSSSYFLHEEEKSSACLSSEDDDMNQNINIIRFQRRKSSRTRHEPYTESVSSLSKNYVRPVSPFSFRKREQSFSGSSELLRFGDNFNRSHRGSEPNPLELIYANRAHLERIYNQSINKANVSPNKELLMLQQENPSIDEKTKLQLQAQHQNLIHNLQHNCFSKDNSDENKIGLVNSNFSPKLMLNNCGLESNYLKINFDKDIRTNTDSIVSPDDKNDNELKSSFHITNNSLNASFPCEVNTENITVNSNNNLSILQIIQEEQNEMSMTLSSSSSLSSSPSITPRSLRSIVSINKPSFEYPIIMNNTEADKLKNNILNQYVLQNNQ